MKFEDITPGTLELQLKGAEHDFVERKSKSDRGGWLETAVAFANSAPIGYPAVLFVGADDDGKPQISELSGLEPVTKSLSSVLDQAFPAIYRHVIPLHLAGGHCLAVIIPGSSSRPHFAGGSFVRIGTETKRASASQFEGLLVQRNSKARRILEYVDKPVKLTFERRHAGGGLRTSSHLIVLECDEFFVLLRLQDGTGTVAHPLERIQLSFDTFNNTLELILPE